MFIFSDVVMKFIANNIHVIRTNDSLNYDAVWIMNYISDTTEQFHDQICLIFDELVFDQIAAQLNDENLINVEKLKPCVWLMGNLISSSDNKIIWKFVEDKKVIKIFTKLIKMHETIA